jgi:UV DNA damage endonuclease
MYRLSSDLAPYLTHPQMPQFRDQIVECARELKQLGVMACSQHLRLSFHPSQYIILNSPDAKLTTQSVHDIESQTEMLDRMELGPEAVVVVHVGGTYGDRAAARQRWARTFERKLSKRARSRLVLENDDISFSAADVLEIHRLCGVRLILITNTSGVKIRSASSFARPSKIFSARGLRAFGRSCTFPRLARSCAR